MTLYRIPTPNHPVSRENLVYLRLVNGHINDLVVRPVVEENRRVGGERRLDRGHGGQLLVVDLGELGGVLGQVPVLGDDGGASGLDPNRLTTTMVGINHNCWSTEHRYDDDDLIPLLRKAYEQRRNDPSFDRDQLRILHIAVTMEAVPSSYFRYYYFRDEMLREQQGAPRTRAEIIMESVPTYWEHYLEQAESDDPQLDPARSRGGIHELELAIDAMNAFFNDTGDVLPINLPNRGGVLPGFDEDVVVEVPARVNASGFTPLPQKPLPHAVRGLVQALAEYQVLAAKTAWEGDCRDGVRALAAHPLVPSLTVAEELYAEMALAHANRLPDRLLPR